MTVQFLLTAWLYARFDASVAGLGDISPSIFLSPSAKGRHQFWGFGPTFTFPTGGTQVLSDWIRVRITAAQGSTFIDRMIKLVEGAERQKTPNEIALTILLSALTFIFLLVIITLKPYGVYAGVGFSITALIALLVCLIPTTIGALLSAIGIAGMDRLVQRNVLAMSGRAVEAAGDCSTLLLDKTGTITYGNRQAAQGRARSCDRVGRVHET